MNNKKNITNEGENLSHLKTPNKNITMLKPPPLTLACDQSKKKLTPLPIKDIISTTFTTQKVEKKCNQNEDVDKIREDLNKDYYIIQNDEMMTQQNDNFLLSSSRKGLFKKLTHQNSNIELTKELSTQSCYNLKARKGLKLNSEETSNILELWERNLPSKKSLVVYKENKPPKVFMKKFFTSIQALRWINRLKIRLAKYGATIRNPKLIVKYDDLMFSKTLTNTHLGNEKIKKPKYIIEESNKYLYWWNILIFTLTFYIVIGLTYRIAFLDNVLVLHSKMLAFDLIVEIIFVIDVILHCLTSFYDKNGNIVYSIKEIIKKYLSTWMIFDLISIFPFYIIEWTNQRYYQKDIRYYFLLFKIPKFYRSLRVIKIVNSIQESKFILFISKKKASYGGVAKILTFIFSSFLICHIFACFWYFIARVDSNNINNWIHRYGLLDKSLFTLYLKSLYFSFAVFVTVGYGDITAYSTPEIIIICFWLLFCGIYYSFNLSILGSVFEESNQKSIFINNLKTTLKTISKQNCFPKALEQKIINYLVNEYNIDDVINKCDLPLILKELNVDLKYKIFLNIYQSKIQKIELFNECKKEFVANFVPLLEQKTYLKNTFIYRVRELPEYIYFIIEGNIVLTTEDKIVFATIPSGKFFGEIEILRKTYRETNAKAKNDVNLLLMKRSLLLDDIVQSDSLFLSRIIETMIKRNQKYQRLIKLIHAIIAYGKKICEQKKILPRTSTISTTNIRDSLPSFFYSKGLEFLYEPYQKNRKSGEIQTEAISELLNSTKNEDIEIYRSFTDDEFQNNKKMNENIRKIRSSLYTRDSNSGRLSTLDNRNKIVHLNSFHFKGTNNKEKQITINEEENYLKKKIKQLSEENEKIKYEIYKYKIKGDKDSIDNKISSCLNFSSSSLSSSSSK